MEHLTGTPLPDPFYAVVRRRHPDADLVLLPPEPPDGERAPVADDVVAAAVARVAAQARELWAVAAPDADDQPVAELTYGDAQADVRAGARLAARRADGHAVLAALRAELGARGWRVVRPPGGAPGLPWMPRLSASHDDLRVRASYAETSGAFVLTLTSAPLPVGRERARRLVRGRR